MLAFVGVAFCTSLHLRRFVSPLAMASRSITRTYYIPKCPLEHEGCSSGTKKPRFTGATEAAAREVLRLHLCRSSKHWKSIYDALAIVEDCEVKYHDEMNTTEATDDTRSRASDDTVDTRPRPSSRPMIGDQPAQRIRLIGPSEQPTVETIVQTAMLAIASARHAVALCNSAAVAFEEQAAVLEECVGVLEYTEGV